MKILCLAFCLISFLAEVSGNTFYHKRKPYIKNFTKKEYLAANQNWSVTQDSDGILYFGNTFGLLEYNGKDWTLHSLPDHLIIRSVLADGKGRVYSGAHEEFGYWQRDSLGTLNYTSISQELLGDYDFRNEDIWTIKQIGSQIFFHSFARIYIYNGHSIESIESIAPIFSILKINDTPYIYLLGNGLYKLTPENKLKEIKTPPFISRLNIKEIVPIDTTTHLLISEFNGLFLKSENQWEPWKCPANQILKNCQINKAVVVGKNQLALGTISHGIYLINKKGEILLHLNQKLGLQNNTTLGLWPDRQGNLWIGLDKGIAYAEINSPFTFIKDETGLLGSVYCASLNNNTLYLGTNHGVFATPWNSQTIPDSVSFKPIPGSKGQAWSLNLVKDQLICGHNSGTFILKGEKLQPISSVNGGGRLIPDPQNPNRFYQGTYIGVAIYEKKGSQDLQFTQMLHHIGDPISFLEFDYLGDLWASHTYKGLFRLKLDPTKKKINQTDRFGKTSGFSSDYHINTFKVSNRVVFPNGGQFYTYDYLEQKMVPYTELNNQLGPYAQSNRVFQINEYEYWFANQKSLGQFLVKNGKLILNHEIHYDLIHSTAVDQCENIWKLNDRSYLIGLDDGFAIYDYQPGNSSKHATLAQIKLHKVESFTSKGKCQLMVKKSNQKVEIPYRNNNLRFYFSIPGQINESLLFYCRLNREEPWSPLGTTSEIRYNNLDWGTYTFEFKAVEKSTGRASMSSYHFSIRPPWYAHPVSLLIYIFLIVALFFLSAKLNRLRLNRQKLKYLKKIKSENEDRLIKMKNSYLQSEVENKSRELANYTMLLSKKNEVLLQLKSELTKEEKLSASKALLLKSKLVKVIDKNLSENNWEHFQTHLDKAHDDYLKKLKEAHPALTPNDLRFCAFLKMNLTSKEIAALLNISIRSTEVKRYRLRKKLEIDHEQNLVDYLMSL